MGTSLAAAVGMSPAERAIYNADRPIFEAAAALEKFAAQLATLRAGLAGIRLPLDAAADHLDHADDELATVGARIERALAEVGKEIDRRQEAHPEHYFAPMSPAAPSAPSVAAQPLRAANDDGLAALVNTLRTGGQP